MDRSQSSNARQLWSLHEDSSYKQLSPELIAHAQLQIIAVIGESIHRTLVCNIKRVGEADIRFHGGRGHHGGEATRAGESHRSAIFMVVIEMTDIGGSSMVPGVKARKGSMVRIVVWLLKR
jgi:hypothetical protein